MPPQAELVRAPLAALADALVDRVPDVVVHGINPIYTRWQEEVLPAAHAAMDLAERFGARFMLPGNVYNHGAAMPALIDETTPQRPTTAKGEIRVALEGELERRCAAGAPARNRDHRRRLLRRRQRQLARPGDRQADRQPAGSTIPATRIWSTPGPICPTWRGRSSPSPRSPTAAPFERFTFAGHSVTGRTFLAAVERAAATLGLAPARGWRHGRMPWPLIRAVGIVVPLWRELARMSYLWRTPHALDGRRLAARCPGLTATPLDEALRESLLALGLGSRRREPQVGARPADIPATDFPSGGTEQCDWSPRDTRPMRDGPRPCHPTWTAPARSCWRSPRPSSAPTRRRSRSSRRRFPAR